MKFFPYRSSSPLSSLWANEARHYAEVCTSLLLLYPYLLSHLTLNVFTNILVISLCVLSPRYCTMLTTPPPSSKPSPTKRSPPLFTLSNQIIFDDISNTYMDMKTLNYQAVVYVSLGNNNNKNNTISTQ